MSQVTYNNEKHDLKKVKYQNDTGSTVTIRGGWLAVYNADFGTATVSDENRAVRVEVNAVGNSEHFAGVIDQRYDGKVILDGGVLQMEIAVPTARGQLVEMWTDQNCTIGVTVLTLQPTSNIAGGIEEGVPIAVAQQTVDRSTTAGTVLARLQWPLQPLSSSGFVSARSRTTVQLPTAAIWDNVPVTSMVQNPFLGSVLSTDFTHGNEGMPTHKYISATYAAAADGLTETEQIYMGPAAVGELRFFTTTDHQKAGGQWNVPITISGGNPWGFEVRIKQSLISDTLQNYFVGLAISQVTLEDALTDAGAIIDGGAIGFQLKEADGNAIDFIFDESGQTQNEYDDNFFIPVADTYDTIGMYFNGTTIQNYLNGVASGTVVLSTIIDDADFPTAAIFFPSIYTSSANAADFTTTIDWMQVGQLA